MAAIEAANYRVNLGNRTLTGSVILVTRPAGLGQGLAQSIRAAGGEVVFFPAIEIAPPSDPAALVRIVEALDRFDIAIFISPSAVVKGHEFVTARRAWPSALRVAAVGSGTAASLAELGFTGVIAPQGQGDSQALAALPEFAQVSGKSIVIFRGEGGRETLRAALQSRGATVTYAQCYRRGRPAADPAPLLARWRRGGVHAVCLTSGEGLENLAGILGPEGAALLRATPVFVPHPRIGAAAEGFGVARTLLTGAGDEQLVAALKAFFAKV
jgi:uroporphyrinogen-III synthase